MHHLDHCLLLHLTRMKAICNPEMCAKQPVTTCDSLGVLQHWTHQDFSLSRLSHPLQAVNNYDKEVFNGDPGYVVSVDAAARRLSECSSPHLVSHLLLHALSNTSLI